MRELKGILFVVNDINVGGAEMFVFRLGKALKSHYQVCVLDIYPERSNPELVNDFNLNGLTVYRKASLTPLSDWLLWKMNALFSLFGFNRFHDMVVNTLRKKHFKSFLSKRNVSIVHSHHYSSDVFVRQKLLLHCKKWVITLHGDYNTRLVNTLSNAEQFIQEAALNFKAADAIAYVADENVRLIHEKKLSAHFLKKIYLGFEQKYNPIEQSVSKNNLVFCMVARSIPTKGWMEAVNSFLLLTKKYHHLEMICVAPKEGIVKELSIQYRDHQELIFTGYSPDPTMHILRADVCLLPTYFPSESTPYSVIEYLSCGKPVIATNVGEIDQMLRTDDNELAGLLIDLENGSIPVNKLTSCMEQMITDHELRWKCGQNALNSFQKFDMTSCVNSYRSIYES
jgi:glycosyltransferase involved in cell wall biosynthesis